MEQNIKSLRIRLDSFSKLAKDSLHQSRQVDKCVDEILLSKAWLGKALGSLNVESPYPKDGDRKNVADIEKTADTADALVMEDLLIEEADFHDKNPVEKVDWLRQAIGKSITSAVTTLNYGVFADKIGTTIIDNVITHLTEARFWLGFELERQKNEA